jgi:L-cysteine desulfidase
MHVPDGGACRVNTAGQALFVQETNEGDHCASRGRQARQRMLIAEISKLIEEARVSLARARSDFVLSDTKGGAQQGVKGRVFGVPEADTLTARIRQVVAFLGTGAPFCKKVVVERGSSTQSTAS